MVELQLHLVKANKECTQTEICEKHQTKCVAGKMDCIIGIKQCELIRMEEWDRDKWLREIEGKTVAISYIGKINSFRRPVARLHRKMQVKRTHCKSWVFNLTDVDHLYVNHLFVMLLLRVFFFCSFSLCVFFTVFPQQLFLLAFFCQFLFLFSCSVFHFFMCSKWHCGYSHRLSLLFDSPKQMPPHAKKCFELKNKVHQNGDTKNNNRFECVRVEAKYMQPTK